MDDKICLVTGGNSGIGFATAAGLAKKGATVVILVRNQARGEAAVTAIKQQSGSNKVELLLAELSDQAAVRAAAAEFKKRHDKLDVLINNATHMPSERVLTADGLESAFAGNYLGAFLLTNLLLDVLAKAAPSRVINMIGGMPKVLDFDNLQGEKHFSGWEAYSQTKALMINFTKKAATEWAGRGIGVYGAYPGLVTTPGTRAMPGMWKLMFLAGRLLRFVKSPEQGAATPIWVASSPDAQTLSGEIIGGTKPTQAYDSVYDATTADRVWEISTRLAHLA